LSAASATLALNTAEWLRRDRLLMVLLLREQYPRSQQAESPLIPVSQLAGPLLSYIVEEAAFRGDADRAFEWLDKAAQSRDPSLGAIALSPFCEKLHKDPRWLPYLRKHGMAPEQLAAIEFDFTLPK
jgi:hypothetical protein